MTDTSVDKTRLEEEEEGELVLWEFVLELLLSNTHTNILQWTNALRCEFKFLQPEAVALLWGEKKKKPGMTYDKLSRGLRYYYKKNIIQKVPLEKFSYRFTCLPASVRRNILQLCHDNLRTGRTKPIPPRSYQKFLENFNPTPPTVCRGPRIPLQMLSTNTPSLNSLSQTPSQTISNVDKGSFQISSLVQPPQTPISSFLPVPLSSTPLPSTPTTSQLGVKRKLLHKPRNFSTPKVPKMSSPPQECPITSLSMSMERRSIEHYTTPHSSLSAFQQPSSSFLCTEPQFPDILPTPSSIYGSMDRMQLELISRTPPPHNPYTATALLNASTAIGLSILGGLPLPTPPHPYLSPIQPGFHSSFLSPPPTPVPPLSMLSSYLAMTEGLLPRHPSSLTYSLDNSVLGSQTRSLQQLLPPFFSPAPHQ